jgi:tryptophan synthase beta chain
MRERKVILSEKDIPRQWYNIMADMPNLPKPPLNPGTLQPVGPDDLSAIFPMSLIEQEVTFLYDKFNGKEVRVMAVEPISCPTLTKGEYRYDFGDTVGLTPLLMMYTLGHDFMPPGIHAGGLRYHGDAPLVCQLYHDGLIEAKAYGQVAVFDAAIQFARTEGIIPAPESAHAIKAAIDEAIIAKEEGKEKVILFNLSGHGYFDLQAYADYLSGKLVDYEYPEEKIKEALSRLPKIG